METCNFCTVSELPKKLCLPCVSYDVIPAIKLSKRVILLTKLFLKELTYVFCIWFFNDTGMVYHRKEIMYTWICHVTYRLVVEILRENRIKRLLVLKEISFSCTCDIFLSYQCYLRSQMKGGYIHFTRKAALFLLLWATRCPDNTVFSVPYKRRGVYWKLEFPCSGFIGFAFISPVFRGVEWNAVLPACVGLCIFLSLFRAIWRREECHSFSRLC